MRYGIIIMLFSMGCAHGPPDVPACVEIHSSKGYCINTISSQEFTVDDENPFKPDEDAEPLTWWEMRPTMVMLPAKSWTKIKTYIITQCKQTGACDKAISSWERTVERVDELLESK